MSDYLLKAISKSGTIRIYAAITTEMVNSAFEIQNPATLSGIILGNVLTAAAICGATLKEKNQRISLAFYGNGRVRKAMAEATADGKIRGYAENCDADFSSVGGEDAKTQINNAIGTASMLTITKDLGLKQPYSGTINCMTGDIGTDIAYYFTQSEQIPSAFVVSTIPDSDSKVEISGGYLIQQIPKDGGFGASGDIELDKIIQTINSGISLNSMLLKRFTPEQILKTLFADVEFEILDKIDLSFECSCNREILLSALSMFDEKTKKEIIENNENIEVICEFCKKKYYITPREIAEFLENRN